jgi:glycosyltransferase involved in cell wall biosynthesis
LAAAILRLLIDHDLAQKLSAEALGMVSTNFTLGKMIGQVSDLYLRLSNDR